VIDWGLGKDLGDATADEPDQGVATEAEMTVRGRALGTPAYMSPEQARGEPVDARADVYAIGAMLYHVLARRPPHDDPTQAADVERGLARPPRPLDDIAPGAPTDLLAIVAKAMAPDPVARYPTAVELAGDLRRFSSGRLVAAHRYSPRQLLGRWIARHRAAVAVAGVAAVVLAVVAAVAIQGIREQRDLAAWQRAVAEQHRAQVEGLFDFKLVDLHEKLQPIGKLELLALVVDRADAYYRNRSVDLAGDEVRRRALTRLHLGDIRVAMGDLPGGLTAYRDALALFARAGDVSSIAGCDDKIGTVLAKQGDLTGGLAAVRQSLAIRRRRADETPDDRDRQRELAAAYVHLGELSFAQEDVASALSSYRESLAISQQLANREPADAEEQRRVARAHGKVGYALYAQLDLPGALAEYRSELAILEAVAARDPANTTLRYNLSGAMDDVADILREQKDLIGALALYRASLAIARRLGEHDPANTEWQRGVSIGEVNVGTTLRDLGDLRGALSSYQAAYSIRARLAAQDPTNADWQYELSIGAERIGNTQRSLGDLAAALAAYRRAWRSANGSRPAIRRTRPRHATCSSRTTRSARSPRHRAMRRQRGGRTRSGWTGSIASPPSIQMMHRCAATPTSCAPGSRGAAIAGGDHSPDRRVHSSSPLSSPLSMPNAQRSFVSPAMSTPIRCRFSAALAASHSPREYDRTIPFH